MLGELEPDEKSALEANPTPELDLFRKLLWQRHSELAKRKDEILASNRRIQKVIDKAGLRVACLVMLVGIAACLVIMFITQGWMLGVVAAGFGLGVGLLHFASPYLRKWIRNSIGYNMDGQEELFIQKKLPCLEELGLARLDRYLKKVQELEEMEESSSAESSEEVDSSQATLPDFPRSACQEDNLFSKRVSA